MFDRIFTFISYGLSAFFVLMFCKQLNSVYDGAEEIGISFLAAALCTRIFILESKLKDKMKS